MIFFQAIVKEDVDKDNVSFRRGDTVFFNANIKDDTVCLIMNYKMCKISSEEATMKIIPIKEGSMLAFNERANTVANRMYKKIMRDKCGTESEER
jgi:hypothetical protein